VVAIKKIPSPPAGKEPRIVHLPVYRTVTIVTQIYLLTHWVYWRCKRDNAKNIFDRRQTSVWDRRREFGQEVLLPFSYHLLQCLKLPADNSMRYTVPPHQFLSPDIQLVLQSKSLRYLTYHITILLKCL
jgi:hypothetical protein